MPKELHNKLIRQARKIGLKGERLDAYVFSTIRKIEDAKRKKK